MVAVTFFKTPAARQKQQVDLDLASLASMVRSAHAPAKEKLPWLKMACFGSKATAAGSLRHDKNVTSVVGVELDYDGKELSFDWACQRVKELGLEALVYTSPSHRPSAPKWRVLLPTSHPLPPGDRVALVDQVDESFGKIFSPESRTLSQSYYYGYVDGNQGNHRVAVFEGSPVDVAGEDPFAAVAEYQVTSAADAENRLRSMAYQSGEDTGVHNTQLSVSASLLNSGVEVDEVVERVISATRDAVGDRDWDWEREERLVRQMCEDWQKKQRGSNVVQLVHSDKKRKIPKGQLHEVLAAHVCKMVTSDGGDFLRTDGQWWVCSGGRWSPPDAVVAVDWLDTRIRSACEDLGVTPTQRIASEVRHSLKTRRSKTSVAWDSHGHLATRSGLVHDDGTVEVIQPSHLVTKQVSVAFDPAATCPQWEASLLECAGSQRVADMVQEVAGAALYLDKPKSMTRALVLVGPSNSGKTTVAEVLAGLASDRVLSPSLDMIESPHGTMPFLRDDPWLLDEAFEVGRWHMSARVKQLLSSDTLPINVKNGPVVTRRYRGPVFWTTNYPPQFREITSAIANRVLIVEFNRVFDPEDVTGVWGAAYKAGSGRLSSYFLETEGPGILNWALAGWRRLRDRGYFSPPDETRAAIDSMREESNVVIGFTKDCVEVSPKRFIIRTDFHAAFWSWWEETSGDDRNRPSPRSIAKALRAVEGVGAGVAARRRVGPTSQRVYLGLSLNLVGLEHWSAYAASSSAQNRADRISDRVTDVNREDDGEETDDRG